MTMATAPNVAYLNVNFGPLAGKKALVTGGSRGIGRGIVHELARLGAEVQIGYGENRDAAEQTMRKANYAYGVGRTSVRSFDFTNVPKSLSIESDILIHCAGISAGRSVAKTEWSEWANVMDVNLNSAFALAKAAVPYMTEKGWGRIVCITSVVGMDGRLGPTSYAASKSGLIGFVKAAAHELARRGITVNAVAPGFIAETGLIELIPSHLMPGIVDSIPLKRLGSVQDVADAVMYLVQAKYVTGTVLNVSGGYLT